MLHHVNYLVNGNLHTRDHTTLPSPFFSIQQPLAGSEVSVPKRAFQRLNRTRMTIFAQELAVLVFTKDVLAQSTLTGKSGKGAPPKTQLDVAKVQAITGV